ncbi:hypothetical protein EV700_2387 [Fluviicoccus keumensis]|uniref:Uncharacterized protein n=1 Tax=Fluviicoccus keumensis TaxID=1435465 RepID=A0A4Q7YP38_9GAMM|nr:hypothetical protein [Fluviicoccus keumensis]RZU38455.1 hypothetical protein EV700_2387 [Fluviicoccus keumensis]
MACCVALGLFITLLRWLWLRLTFRKAQPPVLFAPVARRSEPGQMPLPLPVPAPVAPPLPLYRTPDGGLLIGLGVYLAAVFLLVQAGFIVSIADSGDWLLRTLVYGAAALWLLRPRPADTGNGIAHPVAATLYFTGLVWVVLGVADMHLFDLFVMQGQDVVLAGRPHPHHDHQHLRLALDPQLLFHGGGLLALAAGLLTVWAVQPEPALQPLPLEDQADDKRLPAARG